MEGGTTFHFVTDGIESALRQAIDAAGDRDVRLGGGVVDDPGSTSRAGLIDELHVAVVPVLLGRGERLFDNLDGGPRRLRVRRVRRLAVGRPLPLRAHLEVARLLGTENRK